MTRPATGRRSRDLSTSARWFWEAASRFALPGRTCWLFAGDLADVVEISAQFGDAGTDEEAVSPSLWWPEDLAWVVATDIDLNSTFVAGSERLVAALASADLEVLVVTADTGVYDDADLIN